MPGRLGSGFVACWTRWHNGRFYGSPAGKAATQKFSAYIADIMPTIEARDNESADEVESIAALRSIKCRAHVVRC